MTPFTLKASDFSYAYGDLRRPESVLCTKAGDMFVSHEGEGVKHIRPDGSSRLVGQAREAGLPNLVPNGIALQADGTLLVANIAEPGGVWSIRADMRLRPYLLEVDGTPLRAANFAMVDEKGRVWISVSTRTEPRFKAFRNDVRDGFIVLVDDRGPRIVADGIGFTNECRISPDGQYLFVSETFSRQLSRFPIRADGSLGPKEVFTQFGHGTFPDGCAFDREGALWLTSVVSNRLFRVGPDGEPQIVFEDYDPAKLQVVEDAYLAGRLDRPLLYTDMGETLSHVASISFGGPDLKTAYLGSLKGNSLASFRAPVPGVTPVHWDVRLAW
jgi:sugar lactone lactonase YvrE